MPYDCPLIIAIRPLNAIQTLLKVFDGFINFGTGRTSKMPGLIESYLGVDLFAIISHLSFIKPVILFEQFGYKIELIK